MKRLRWKLYSGLGFLTAYFIGLSKYGWNSAVIALGFLSACLIVADMVEQIKTKKKAY